MSRRKQSNPAKLDMENKHASSSSTEKDNAAPASSSSPDVTTESVTASNVKERAGTAKSPSSTTSVKRPQTAKKGASPQPTELSVSRSYQLDPTGRFKSVRRPHTAHSSRSHCIRAPTMEEISDHSEDETDTDNEETDVSEMGLHYVLSVTEIPDENVSSVEVNALFPRDLTPKKKIEAQGEFCLAGGSKDEPIALPVKADVGEMEPGPSEDEVKKTEMAATSAVKEEEEGSESPVTELFVNKMFPRGPM